MTDRRSHLRKGIYLLPNLFTTVALFAAFYSIVASMKGMYSIAAITIFIAMIADSLDGRMARLTNTQTAFGEQYDSLSDMVAFGIAPALLAYSSTLQPLGKIGWLVAFLYVAGACLRLARFNSQIEETDPNNFTGLPSPSGAALVTSLLWVANQYGWLSTHWFSIVAAVITPLAGVLMVSNIRYPSFKQFDVRNNIPFVALFIMACVFILIMVDPPKVLFVSFGIYILWGLFQALRQSLRRKK